jgi:hypothetical protein
VSRTRHDQGHRNSAKQLLHRFAATDGVAFADANP